MSGIDLEGLQDFANSSDRDAPPYFAGREDVIRSIEGTVSRCWNAWRNGRGKTVGATRVIYGAPGAGKSSILKHLERTWPGPGGGAPAMLRIPTPGHFEKRYHVAEKLADLLQLGLGARVGQAIRKTWSMQAGLGGVGGHYVRVSSKAPPLDPVDAVLEHLQGKDWPGPVVIAIDEFQNTAGDEQSDNGKILAGLHEGAYDAPVVAVLAGLSDAIDTVDRLGVSRRSVRAKHSIGSLKEGDTRELLVGWSGHFGVPDGSWQDTVLDLARADSFWPAHVHNALASFATEVVRSGGDMERVDMRCIRAGARDRRREYYEARMSPELRKSKWLLAAVVADFQTGTDSGEVINLIERHTNPESDDVRWRLPKCMDAEDYYRHILHRGVVQEDGMVVVTPIPSFRSWIIATCSAP